MDMFSDQNLMSIWGAIKESMRANTTRGKEANGLDCSFITPTLLAMGKLQENMVDELMHVLQGSPAVLWNLSGKPFSQSIRQKLNAQVLDASWVTPGQFTQAPSLECIFSHCYSIKSWLDLKNDHVAIIHCGNGRSRSGILIACLLKYIGAFDHATHAFDFFCGARMQIDSKPSLAPSYRILFENIDKAVDQGGYPNPQPMHFKCLAISGLPVDEIPCVEVWDMHGQVFVSHIQWKHTNKCTWSADYGDGFFRVSQDIYGDFSVMVRFGGNHALTRDKTTLIFKYQNSTAFLPPEVVELKRQNVDVNPEYSDSLDVELFAVHLMFEKAVGDAPRGEFRPYRLQGREAFEAGLDEISKQHAVEPDSAKVMALANMGYPDSYTSLALQLANNSLDQAAAFIQSMKARAHELDASMGLGSAQGSDQSTPIRRTVSGSALAFSASSPYVAATPGDLAAAQLGSFGGADATSPGRDDGAAPQQSPGPDISDAAMTCPECREDGILKRDQLVPCTKCGRVYHTGCFGARRIPFSLKTPRERQNRDKYVTKHYGRWQCAQCDPAQGPFVGGSQGFASPTSPSPSDGGGNITSPFGGMGSFLSGVTVFDVARGDPHSQVQAQAIHRASSTGSINSSPGSGQATLNSNALARSQTTMNPDAQPWIPSYSPSGAVGFKQGNGLPTPGGSHTPAKTKHDQAAILMGLLAATGITVEQLMDMGEDKQKEALLAAASMYSRPRTASGSESVAVSSTSARLGSPRQPNSPGVVQESVLVAPDPDLGGTILRSPMQQEKKRVDDDASASGAGAAAVPNSDSKNDTRIPVVPSSSEASTAAPPAPPSPVPEVSGRSALMAMLAKRQSQESGVVTVNNPIAAVSEGPKLQDDPLFAKYIKMVKVGLPKGSVAAKMQMEGVVESIEKGMEILSMAADGPAPSVQILAATADKSAAEPAKVANSGDGDRLGLVPVSEHPSYAKYFKMLKVGLPKEKVRQRMQEEGKNVDYLDMEPSDLVPLAEQAAPDPNAAASMVPVAEHPTYSKYFRMLKVGLPKDAIKSKMQQEGADPSFLDKDPAELVAVAVEGAKVPVSEHPNYAKYFKMLKLGLPRDTIKAKMTQDGFNTSYIDLNPEDAVPLEEVRPSASAAKGAEKIKGPRKKKLHWKGLDASKVGQDSLWADKDDGMNIMLDEAEFNQLFVERYVHGEFPRQPSPELLLF